MILQFDKKIFLANEAGWNAFMLYTWQLSVHGALLISCLTHCIHTQDQQPTLLPPPPPRQIWQWIFELILQIDIQSTSLEIVRKGIPQNTIGSDNDLVASGKKSLPDKLLT